MNDLTFAQLQSVPNTSADTFFIGNSSAGTPTILLDISKLLGVIHTVENPADLDLEEVCGMAWKLFNLAYEAQERYNSSKAAEEPNIRAFVRPVVTVESTQATTPIGNGRAVLNVRVPYIPQTIDPQTETT